MEKERKNESRSKECDDFESQKVIKQRDEAILVISSAECALAV
jgi:hypothetical protein